jgi:hypothetical protein
MAGGYTGKDTGTVTEMVTKGVTEGTVGGTDMVTGFLQDRLITYLMEDFAPMVIGGSGIEQKTTAVTLFFGDCTGVA